MTYKINLLSHKKEQLLDRLIYFALNYLRYILVITQIIVIAVFLIKIKVDQEIIDLQDSIDQKKEIVMISQNLLKEAQAADFKISAIKDIITSQDELYQSITYLLSIFPKQFSLSNLAFQDNALHLEGTSLDAQTIQLFLKKLQADKKFKDVQLTTIEKKDTGYSFSFTISQFST